jgi:DNA-binding MarR family transcriptional regulator
MATAFKGDELIDVFVRLPRKTLEETLLFAASAEDDLADRRLRQAKALLTSLRKRAAYFSGVRFYDPNWDIIMELYVATQELRQLSVTQLCSFSGGSMTTALRHVDHLEALGYISRRSDTDDRRRASVTMLPALRAAVEQWLDSQHVASRGGC